MTTVAGLALVAATIRGNRQAMAAAAAFLAFVLAPPVGVGVALLIVVMGVMSRRRRPPRRDGDEAMLAELTALGLNAGLTFQEAARAATISVPGEASEHLRRAVRLRGRANADADQVPGLMVVVNRALTTGAPLLPAVAGYAAALRGEERSRQLVAARRLPVKLLFPLALLILPGFLILTIGPAVLGSLERLGL